MVLALVMPERFARLPELPPELASAAAREFAELRQLVSEARQSRPAENSPEEAALLERLLKAALRITVALGQQGLLILRDGVQYAISELLKLEFAATATERKLALRHLQTALNGYGTALEAVASRTSTEVSPTDMQAFLAAVRPEQLAEALTDEAALTFFRWQLELMVALETLEGSVEELAYWAHRAVINSRKTTAWLPTMRPPAGLRGELARQRARHSWDNWDQEEIQRELQPWPNKRTSSR